MKIYTSLFAVGLMGSIALIATSSANAAELTTQDFVTQAAITNKFEIESSKIALEKSETSAVKDFAKQMVTDHTATGEKLKETIASSDAQVGLPEKLDYKHQALLDKLSMASDKEFDMQFITAQLDAHEEAVTLFTDYSKSGDDVELKGFATDTLPALNKHLDHVQQLENNQNNR